MKTGALSRIFAATGGSGLSATSTGSLQVAVVRSYAPEWVVTAALTVISPPTPQGKVQHHFGEPLGKFLLGQKRRMAGGPVLLPSSGRAISRWKWLFSWRGPAISLEKMPVFVPNIPISRENSPFCTVRLAIDRYGSRLLGSTVPGPPDPRGVGLLRGGASPCQ